jgi:cytidylate kinase
MIIAIDGPSGTGKSTVAKAVAKSLGFTFFDTGAMYRSMAWWLSQKGVNVEDEQAVAAQLPEFHYEIKGVGDDRKYYVDQTDVTEKIRSHNISTLASKIAIYKQVRSALVKIQREFGTKANAVFEGRDMGSVVFPDAKVKIFLTAAPEVRAQRRLAELNAKDPNGNYEFDQILKDIQERDLKDSTREISPLKQAHDAILLDTSMLTADQVTEQIIQIAKR